MPTVLEQAYKVRAAESGLICNITSKKEADFNKKRNGTFSVPQKTLQVIHGHVVMTFAVACRRGSLPEADGCKGKMVRTLLAKQATPGLAHENGLAVIKTRNAGVLKCV